MPRIRTIKPEFCTSEQVAECSPTARLLFILMWLHCDDAGRHPESVKRLKMECMPGDGLSDMDVQALVDELINADLIVRYEWNGKAYWQVTGWDRHQRIDKPSYRYPPLDGTGSPLPVIDESGNIRRHVLDMSLTVQRHVTRGLESTGSLQESTSAAARAAVDEWSQTDFDEVTRQANKLRRACRSLPREFVWQACAIAETVSPGMVSDLVLKLQDGDIRKPKSYIESAIRNECDKRWGIDWREVQAIVPPPLPACEPEGKSA